MTPTVNLLHTFVDNGALLLKSLLHSCLVFSVSAHGIALLLGLIANQSEIYDYIIFLENYTINQIWYFNDPILQWTFCFYIVRVGRQLKTNWDILKQSKTKIVKLRQGIRPLHFIGQIFSWIHHPLRPEVSPQFSSSFSALHIQDSIGVPSGQCPVSPLNHVEPFSEIHIAISIEDLELITNIITVCSLNKYQMFYTF